LTSCSHGRKRFFPEAAVYFGAMDVVVPVVIDNGSNIKCGLAIEGYTTAPTYVFSSQMPGTSITFNPPTESQSQFVRCL